MSQFLEIDDAIAAEAAETSGVVNSLDALNNRRMTCRFFGHGKLRKLDKYKGMPTWFCTYCAEIIGYGDNEENLAPSTNAVFFWDWMEDPRFNSIVHPEDKKK